MAKYNRMRVSGAGLAWSNTGNSENYRSMVFDSTHNMKRQFLYRYNIPLNRDQASCTFKDLLNVRLLRQHKPLRLVPQLRKAPPALKVLRLPLIAMRLLGVLPVTL